MRSKVILAMAFALLALFVLHRHSGSWPKEPRQPVRYETPPLHLPDGFILLDVTLHEALNAFYDWYKAMYPPMQQSISLVVKNGTPDDLGKRGNVDLSGISVNNAIPRIAMALGLSCQYFNGRYHIGRPETATRGVAVDADEKLSRTNYLHDFLTTNVIAGVVGYETTRQVAENVALPFFSASAAPHDGRVNGVLFKVVAPSKHADKFFWLINAEYDERTSPANLYAIDSLYSFKLNMNEMSSFGAVSTNEFFSIPSKTSFSSTTWAAGHPFFTAVDDVNTVCKQMEEHLIVLSNEFIRISTRLNNLDSQTPEYSMDIAELEGYSREIKILETRLKMLSNDVGRIESNRELIESLFMKFDFKGTAIKGDGEDPFGI